MDSTETNIQIGELIDQAESLDEDQQNAIIAVLMEDLNSEFKSQSNFAPPPYKFQQIYDTVSNEERIIRGIDSEEFNLVAGVDLPSGITRKILNGELSMNEVLDQYGPVTKGLQEDHLPKTGKKFRDKLAAACREEICEDDVDIFTMPNQHEAVKTLTPIISAVIVGSITGSLFIPIAVLVALFIIQVGYNVYCEGYSDSADVV
jgi:hypothetical protein